MVDKMKRGGGAATRTATRAARSPFAGKRQRMLALTSVAEQPNEASPRITAIEIRPEFFFHEGWDCGIRIVRISEALDQ
jgi:hypothetical protein